MRFDIFCKIVDNFGDIGVCWRLAKQLQQEHHMPVRLWVDDLAIAKRIIPELDIALSRQILNGVEVCLWTEAVDEIDIPDVVIEAFACELPIEYQRRMQAKKPLWINLEYLSAEKWVDEYHAQSSIHPQLGLKRYFYFPGFSTASGGLIREGKRIEARDQFLQSNQAQAKFWNSIGVSPHDRLKVSLFCYPHAPVS